MPAMQKQIEGTTPKHRIKGRSLLLHLRKKDQISIVESLRLKPLHCRQKCQFLSEAFYRLLM